MFPIIFSADVVKTNNQHYFSKKKTIYLLNSQFRGSGVEPKIVEDRVFPELSSPLLQNGCLYWELKTLVLFKFF